MPTTDTRPTGHLEAGGAIPPSTPRAAAGSMAALPPSRATGWTTSATVIAAMLAVTLVVVAAIAVVATRPTADELSDTTVTSTPISEADALRRLIAKGYVPTAAIPSSLYTAEELATIRLVRAGVLPPDLLQTERMVTKGLIDRGLVPPGSVR